MNALERNAENFAHRGQRIGLRIPPGVTVLAGERIRITMDSPHAWRMPATVIEVQPNGVATIEPGAAVKHPEEWFCPEWNEAVCTAATPTTHDQGELF